MNENPVGTPNPLNPGQLDANPSEPVEETNKTQIPITTPSSVPETEMAPVSAPETEMMPDLAAQKPQTEGIVTENVSIESLDPSGRPMEKVVETPAPVPEKKNKLGLIIGLVVCLFVAVGCGVAAVLMMMNSEKDAVAVAMQKVMNGGLPENVAIDGTIEFNANDKNNPISKMTIALDSQMRTGSMINASSAEVALVLSNGKEFSFDFDEVYATDGELYFKVEGVSELLDNLTLLNSLTNKTEVGCMGNGVDDIVNCITENTTVEVQEITDCVTECMAAGGDCDISKCTTTDIEIIAEQGSDLSEITDMLFSKISVIDGEWLKVPLNQFDISAGGITIDSDVSCMIDLIGDINKNSNSAAELYNRNPFLASTTENITIDSKQNPVRKITVDDEKFANFINSIQNTEMTSELYDCLGWDNNVKITPSDVTKAVNQFPAIYTEVDRNNNFSRLYMVAEAGEGLGTIKIDLSFKYPSSINVSEPVEYTNYEDMIQKIMTSVYDIDETVVEENE